MWKCQGFLMLFLAVAFCEAYCPMEIIKSGFDPRWLYSKELSPIWSNYANYNRLFRLLKMPLLEDELLGLAISSLKDLRSLCRILTRELRDFSPLNCDESPKLICFIGCYRLKLHGLLRSAQDKSLCPNPCVTQQTCTGENTCVLAGWGFFQQDYHCQCHKEFGFVYDRFTKSCRRLPGCEAGYCNFEGTLGCFFDSHYLTTRCICKPTHAGDRCASLRDPCALADPKTNYPPGNVACNVNNDANKCRINNDTRQSWRKFICVCDDQKWQPDVRYRHDNCLMAKTQCIYKYCGHGKCVSSLDGRKVACKCNPGYSGQFCTHRVGNWTTWSAWLPCQPICGQKRFALRFRSCQSKEDGSHGECIGPTLDKTDCEPQPCKMSEEQLSRMYFAFRTRKVHYGILLAIMGSMMLFTLVEAFIKLFKNKEWHRLEAINEESELSESSSTTS